MTVNQLIWALLLIGLPAALAFHHIYGARRTADLKRFAEQLGYSYAASDASLESELSMSLPIFENGKQRRFHNVMRGTVRGREVTVFDYRHRVGGALTTLTHNSLLSDLVIGYDKNRQVTYYSMTMVALRAQPVSQPVHERVPGLPGGHTRLERVGTWLVVYRFDRRVPADELQAFIETAVATGAAADTPLQARNALA